MLFDIDVVPRQTRRRRSVLMSLYDDNTAAAKPNNPTVTPEPSQSLDDQKAKESEAEQALVTSTASNVSVAPIEPFEPSAPILADTLTQRVETVADRISAESTHTVISDRLGYSSFDQLGLNERYLLASELFGDDPQLCTEQLALINGFDNYDDAMIYIAENFSWQAESEGAKLLISILESKFNIC